MGIIEFRKKLSTYRSEKQSFLNDTYHWVTIAINAINSMEVNTDILDFEVPGTNGKLKRVQRKDVNKMITRITSRDIYYSAYVMMISSIEDYFSKIIRLILEYDNNRLKYIVPSISMETNISVVDFIDKTKEQMIDGIIADRIAKLFYASPLKQLEYLKKALGLSISDEKWNYWIKYKALRDVIVHNNGIINEIYMNKVLNDSQYKNNDEVIINEVMFKQLIIDLKSLIGEIDRLVRNEFHVVTSKELTEMLSILEEIKEKEESNNL